MSTSSDDEKISMFFLPSLIDYIQTMYEIPRDLPMIYNSVIPNNDSDDSGNDDNDSNDSDGNSDGYSILSLNSPLSQNSQETKLDIEVMGIYTDDNHNDADGKNIALPSMAMVIVKKINVGSESNGGSTGTNVMMKRLFDDCESKIIKSLDIGLDDFIDGRVSRSVTTSSTRVVQGPNVNDGGRMNNIQVDNDEWSALDELDTFYEGFDSADGTTLEDLLVASSGMSVGTSTSNMDMDNDESNIVDAVVSDFSPNNINVIKDKDGKKIKTNAPSKLNSNKGFANTSSSTSSSKGTSTRKKKKTVAVEEEETESSASASTSVDFAVQAAKAAAAMRKKKKEEEAEAEAKLQEQEEELEPHHSSCSCCGGGGGKGGSGDITTHEELIDISGVNFNDNYKVGAESTDVDAGVGGVNAGGGGGGDFAVEAAKAKAKKAHTTAASSSSTTKEESKGGDFAVEAAKRAAAAAAKSNNTLPLSKRSKKAKTQDEIKQPQPQPVRVSVQEVSTGKSIPMNSDKGTGTGTNSGSVTGSVTVSPMLQNISQKGSNAFKVKISSSTTFMKKSNIFEHAIAEKAKAAKQAKQQQQQTIETIESEQEEEQTRVPKKKKKKQRKINLVTDMSVDESTMTEEERQKSLDTIPFQNPVSTSTSTFTSKSTSTSATSDSSTTPEKMKSNTKKPKITKTDAEIEQDIIKAAMEIMPGNINVDDDNNNNGGMTPEEMLKNILKFGEEEDKKDAPGSGFTRGAFTKAKEIIGEEQQLQQQQLQQQQQQLELQFKEVEDDNVDTTTKPLSAEEELKRIFAAGQNIAEGRMTTATTKTTTSNQNTRTSSSNLQKEDKSIVTEQYIDELIEADKTVPGNARTLDDELAELEVRISKSPGEDTEAYGPDPIFDVFSGPEVYNPNVDPETSVNWPGAQFGTRTDIRLPPELNDAVNSAKFAAKLLSKMIEEKDDDDEETKVFYIDGKEISKDQVEKLQRCVDEGVAVGLIEDPVQYMRERSRLQMLVDELCQQPEERFSEIANFYKDILLSENFVTLVRDQLRSMASRYLDTKRSNQDTTEVEERIGMEREVLGKLVKFAQLLLKEAQALGAELEAQQLEVIRSICNVAMDPKHETEEQTAEALTDAVRDMRPMLDENFVAYLKYAIAEEEARLARAGLVDDPEHNRWLFVLKIIQEGVYAELAVGVQRYIDHISYVLRMDTKKERKELLSKLIDVMPSMDVRPFVKVVDNIAASLGQGRKGEFDTAVLGGMTNKVLQLRRDVHELLPPERIKVMSKDADEWAARQRQKLMDQRGVARQRLDAARGYETFESIVERKGEIDRFD